MGTATALPPCAAAEAKKTRATTAMAGAQTVINNQLNAAAAKATETCYLSKGVVLTSIVGLGRLLNRN
jgi:hypothetical protein